MKKKLLLGVGVLIIIGIAFVLYRSIFPIDIFVMQDTSMEPTIVNNGKLTLNKFDKEFERTDIVIINNPKTKTPSAKRIIGLPNEKLEIKNGKVFINSTELVENYIKGETKKEFNVVLGSDEYYVMGDNREQSFDSRGFGSIKKSDIVGKVAQ